jgi:hypothetical protein
VRSKKFDYRITQFAILVHQMTHEDICEMRGLALLNQLKKQQLRAQTSTPRRWVWVQPEPLVIGG